MSNNTKIEWCDTTLNVVTGCRKVSEGCRHCYAERIASRFWGPRKFTDVQLHPERLGEPLKWRKPRRVFVNSMSDLFHEDVPVDFIANVFAVMALAERHTFMVLTKRPRHMHYVLMGHKFADEYTECIRVLTENSWTGYYEPLPNVWLGVSAEDQSAYNTRTEWLMRTPAAVRFVSAEPLLSHLCLGPYPEVDWVIAGCESGPGARPMDLEWARSLRDQCSAAGVPFFLKQAVINGVLTKMPALDGVVHGKYPVEVTA